MLLLTQSETHLVEYREFRRILNTRSPDSEEMRDDVTAMVVQLGICHVNIYSQYICSCKRKICLDITSMNIGCSVHDWDNRLH
jgi:hypothetical protein